jgi:polyisoprenoid-binding protein YceI
MKSRSRSRSRPIASERARLAARALLAFGACAAIAYGANATAGPEVFRVDPELTRAEFAVNHFWVTRLRGSFGRAEGTVALDPEGHAGSIEFSVDASSVDTGWSVRDDFIRGENMFDTARYPIVRFRSTQLIFNHVHLIGVAGELTLHNITRPVVLKVERMECGPEPGSGREGCGVAVVSSIKRSEFGMKFGLPFVGDDIDLSFHLTAHRVAAP